MFRGSSIVVIGLILAGCNVTETASEATSVEPAEVQSGSTEPASTSRVETVTSPAPTAPESSAGSDAVSSASTTSSAASAPATTSAATTTTTTTAPAPPPPNDQLESLALGVELVADIRYPTAVAWRPGDPAMYVSTEDGYVYRVDGDESEIVADISALTVEFEPGSERGLLGLAFGPDDRLYLNYTDLDHDTHVVSYEMVDDVADLATRREVLFIDQPGLGHNGGRLLFDADGNLFIASGDGGGSNGRDAQDTEQLFGALLRVRPSPDGDGYGIPEDNPFADGVEDRPEVWARGLRNPWTFSIDEATGDMWIGDVGNESREEIDLIPSGTNGQNFGWYWWEGSEQRHGNVPVEVTPPVHDYPRSDGVAVMGGHVYRGEEIPALQGAYLFGDLTGPIWALGADGVTRMDAEPVTVLVGWGEDPAGELYLLSLEDGVFKLVQR